MKKKIISRGNNVDLHKIKIENEQDSFKITTINVGDRQSGRIQAESVINCDPNSESIALSIKKIYTTL